MLAGCEGYRCGEGIVKDASTKLPLDSVLCTVITGSEYMFTDSTGEFELCNGMSGCLFGCKDITVEFSKPGYMTITKTNEDCNGIIYLEK